jgi:hypothetical protein
VAVALLVAVLLVPAAAAFLLVLAVLEEGLGRVLPQPVVDRCRVADRKVALRVLGVETVGVGERC